MAEKLDDWQSCKDLAAANLYMLENGIMADVKFTFPADGQGAPRTLNAHKYVLISRSSVFFTMFCGSLPETGPEVYIPEIDYKVFKEFLVFLYTNNCIIYAENVLHLLYSATKYQVTELVNRCRTFLANNINENTVLVILEQAVFYDEKVLQLQCTRFLMGNVTKNVGIFQKVHITRATLDTILSDEEKIMEENDLVSYCLQWSEDECKSQGKEVIPENMREVLGPLVYKLRIPTLSMEDFSSVVANSHLLDETDELNMYRCIGGADKWHSSFPQEKRRSNFYISSPGDSSIDIVSHDPWKIVGFTSLPQQVSSLTTELRPIIHSNTNMLGINRAPADHKILGGYIQDDKSVLVQSSCKKLYFICNSSSRMEITDTYRPASTLNNPGAGLAYGYPVGGFKFRRAEDVVQMAPKAISILKNKDINCTNFGPKEVWKVNMGAVLGEVGFIIQRKLK